MAIQLHTLQKFKFDNGLNNSFVYSEILKPNLLIKYF